MITVGDGNQLALFSPGPQPRIDPLVARPGFGIRNGEVSPDGQLLAYDTNESGQAEIVVRPFPSVDAGRWQISVNGGSKPLWSHDGHELFYVALAGGIMRVQVTRGATISFSVPTKLVGGPYTWALPDNARRQYDVSRIGDRFVVMKLSPNAPQQYAPESIVVVQNWTEELKQRVPVK